MAIHLICVCGKSMSLPDKYAGEHVQCPDCQAMLHVPSPEEDERLARWNCECGTRLKARAQSAGRKVKCPKCGKLVEVPGDGRSRREATPPPGATGMVVSPDRRSDARRPPAEAPTLDAVAEAPPMPDEAPTPEAVAEAAPVRDIDISSKLEAATRGIAAPPDASGDIDISQQAPMAIPLAGTGEVPASTKEIEAALELADGGVEEIVRGPSAGMAEIAPRIADPKDLALGEPEAYGVGSPDAVAQTEPPPAEAAEPGVVNPADAGAAPEPPTPTAEERPKPGMAQWVKRLFGGRS